MGSNPHPLRHALVAIVAVAVLLASCSFAARKFDFAFPAEGGRPELPVVLADETGLVDFVGPIGMDPPPVFPEGMTMLDASPNALIAHWTGAECEASVAITVSGSESITIAVVITNSPDACDAIGVRRLVLIQLTRPVDRSRTTVTIERSS